MRDLALGKHVSIPDVRYKAAVALGKLVPHSLVSAISGSIGR
jgi:hypothetical protein